MYLRYDKKYIIPSLGDGLLNKNTFENKNV